MLSGANFPSLGGVGSIPAPQHFQAPVQAAAPVFTQPGKATKTGRSNPKVQEKRLNAVYKIRTGQDQFGLIHTDLVMQMGPEDRQAYNNFVQWGMANGYSFDLRTK